jgi:hypothetical protein
MVAISERFDSHLSFILILSICMSVSKNNVR